MNSITNEEVAACFKVLTWPPKAARTHPMPAARYRTNYGNETIQRRHHSAQSEDVGPRKRSRPNGPSGERFIAARVKSAATRAEARGGPTSLASASHAILLDAGEPLSARRVVGAHRGW